jgi:S1-C subfamily serine protease
MQRPWIVITAAALVGAPAGMPAQRAPRAPRAPRAFAYTMTDNRGRIGVIVKTDADPESDKIGAKIEGVTPGGPAEKAGLKVGDVITKFSGTSLADVKAEDEEESGPGKKLVELARKLEPGDTVQVEYRRGSDAKKATLVAEDLGSSFRVEMPEVRGMIMPHIADMNFEFFEPWGDMSFVSLNPDLGEYFGTKEGILVVKAPSDSSLPLRGGDVILTIGGRKPTSPSHAMRILRSYDEGETVSIELMRKQKRVTLSWKVPGREERSRRRMEHDQREEQSGFHRLPHHLPRVQRV